MPEYEQILVERDGPVAKVTLNRPERMNAWTWQMYFEFRHAFDQLDLDESVRAIVLTGAGRAFCAGADLGGAGATFSGDSEALGDLKALGESYGGRGRSPEELATPVIAAINGAAVGAGLTMTVPCDIRIAAEDAKLGFVFNRRGVIPDADIIWTVPRMIGFSRAMDILLTGRIFSGAEAAEMGFVSRAVPKEQVVEVAMEAAHDIAKNTGPVSAAVTKKLAWKFFEEPDRKAAAAEQLRLFAWAGQQADAAEGVIAFLQKRDPQWKLSKIKDLPPELAG